LNIRLDRRLAAILVVVAIAAFAAGVFAASAAKYLQKPTASHPSSSVSPKESPVGPSASPNTSLPPVGATVTCPAGELVSNADQLKQALSSASPGRVIVLGAGTYAGQFVAKVSGTQQAPITLCGPREAVIDGGETKLGYSLYLNAVDWWRVLGFSIQGGQKGLVADHAHHDLIQGLYVHEIGDEAIHLRVFSTDNVVDGNVVRNTGLNNKKFGEGLYVGTAHSNWCKYTNCNPDNSDRNVLRNNDIANTTAENIDIKEGTTAGVIENNHLSGDGMVASAASAWINVKGNEWTIVGNIGRHSIKDGFQVHNVYNGWGERNVFRSNHAEVDGPGYGFYVQSKSLLTVITCDNTAVAAGRGFSNAQCSG
jgi:hypothetical protein